uniref:Uncharacterized protein n=1 Tax=Calcidiscus leptoporus TaxID=127549 RepID=A0A7S0NS59_9EUKA|mmetsp:Transcript_2217/g.4974  ORF Transcript_2217/g.4974 Transcript_2217/m.4974 type:complete len:271 (+) Transcript_2217:60-872(+)
MSDADVGSLSGTPSVTSSQADQVEYFRSQGCSPDVAAALYMAMRLQDKGKAAQAVVYYSWVLRAQPDCQVAQINLRMLVTLNEPDVRRAITAAFDAAEGARRQEECQEAAARLVAAQEDAVLRRAEEADVSARLHPRWVAFLEASSRARQQRDADLRAQLEEHFAGMDISGTRLQDVRRRVAKGADWVASASAGTASCTPRVPPAARTPLGGDRRGVASATIAANTTPAGASALKGSEISDTLVGCADPDTRTTAKISRSGESSWAIDMN